MTDKQIIIDGVDVAGCEFAVKPINDNRIKCHCAKGLLQIAKMQEQPESIKSGLCENNHNCYYKQLKCKEQECKKLYIQLKADAEYHKEEENTLRKIIKNKEERNIELYKENNKLKQTLTEIKEMCNSEVCDYIQCSLNYNHSEDFECEKTSCGRAHRRKFILEILQKISEVENAR